MTNVPDAYSVKQDRQRGQPAFIVNSFAAKKDAISTARETYSRRGGIYSTYVVHNASGNIVWHRESKV